MVEGLVKGRYLITGAIFSSYPEGDCKLGWNYTSIIIGLREVP